MVLFLWYYSNINFTLGEKMGDLTKSINELFVWSENPRHSDEIDDTNISENEIINILINVVGYDYMFNLAKDILEEGLMGSTRPIVVNKNNRLLVYDGNRRIAAIKFLLNANIINDDNMMLRNRVNQLILDTPNADTKKNRLISVKVFETDEQTAYIMMDKIHGGIRDGVGTLPWDAYQKDKSNNKRGITLNYPSAFNVVSKLRLRKNNIKDEYTSFDRIFGNANFKELFQITDYIQIDESYLRQIYDLLQVYKTDVKQGLGFSRIFNKATEEANNFYEWANPQINPAAHYVITFEQNQMNIFVGQNLPQNSLNYIITNFDGSPVQININQRDLKFISPSGQELAQLDSAIIGLWKYRVRYQQSENSLNIMINNFLDPILVLREISITKLENEAITNLKDNILVSTNSINENIKAQVQIVSTANIVNFSFLGNNNLGEHTITYTYTDRNTGKQATATLVVKVIPATQNIMVTPITQNRLLTFSGPPSINNYFSRLNPSLTILISQINSLDVANHKYVLAASLRAAVHLIDEEAAMKKGTAAGTDLPKQLSNLLKPLIDDFRTNHTIIAKEPWVNETGLFDIFRSLNSNKQWLLDILNCGAHSAGSLLSETEIRSAGEKISQILTYTAILLN